MMHDCLYFFQRRHQHFQRCPPRSYKSRGITRACTQETCRATFCSQQDMRTSTVNSTAYAASWGQEFKISTAGDSTVRKSESQLSLESSDFGQRVNREPSSTIRR